MSRKRLHRETATALLSGQAQLRTRRPNARRRNFLGGARKSFRCEQEVPPRAAAAVGSGRWWAAAGVVMGKRDRADRGETWRGGVSGLLAPAGPLILCGFCLGLLRGGRPQSRSRPAHAVGTGRWVGVDPDLRRALQPG